MASAWVGACRCMHSVDRLRAGADDDGVAMADLPGTSRVAVSGGGDAGVSWLHHLGCARLADCLPVEKSELTAGSTWHAARNVVTFPVGRSFMNLLHSSAELERGLAAALGHPINCHVAGSIRLAHSRS